MYRKCWVVLSVGWMLILSMQVYCLRQRTNTAQSDLPSFSQTGQSCEDPKTEQLDHNNQSVSFPYALEGYDITVRTLMIYEGPFREDGSETPVVGAMAVILENTGKMDILSVRLELRQGDCVLHFDAYCIPAGAKVMVVEKNAQQYTREPVTVCRCLAMETGNLILGEQQIRLEPYGRCDILVTNNATEVMDVTLVYKLYMDQQDLYMGGIAYSFVVSALQPGETRMVRPYPFTWNGARILAVITQICENGVQ